MASAPDETALNSSPRWLNAATVCLIMSVAFFRAGTTVADPDIWGHMKMGLDMCQSGALPPATDPYSYLSADYPVIDHEWLSQVIWALIYRATGVSGLIWYKVFLGLATLGLFYRYLSVQGLDPLRGGMIILLITFVFLQTLGRVAVGLTTCLFLPILLLLLRRAEQGRPRCLWVVPPLIALWVNLHPGVIAAIGVLAVWSATHLALALYRRRVLAVLWTAPEMIYVLTAIAGMLATLVNPYGAALPLLLLERGVGPRTEVTEFLPLGLISRDGLVYLIFLDGAIVGVVYSKRPRSLPLLTVLACTAVTPFLAVRHLILFVTAVVILAGEHIADVWLRWSPPSAVQPGMAKALPAPLFIVSALLVAISLPEFRCVRLGPEYKHSYPTRAVALLKDAEVRGNMVVLFDWGEYVLWHLGPGVQVSVDGRREIAYSDLVHRLNFQFLHGVGQWDVLLEMGPADLVLMHKGFAAFNLMKLKPGWQLVYDDELCGLFARQGSPIAERLRQTSPRQNVPANGAGRCFPDDL